MQRPLILRRLAYRNFADGPINDIIVTYGLYVNIDFKIFKSAAPAVACTPCRAPPGLIRGQFAGAQMAQCVMTLVCATRRSTSSSACPSTSIAPFVVEAVAALRNAY
jgi:hypothetical protein